MEIQAKYYATDFISNDESSSDEMFKMIRENRIKDLLVLFQSTPRDKLFDLVNTKNPKYNGMFPINYAIRSSANHLILIMLLRLGAKVDNSAPDSPLFLAVRSGLTNLVKILLISGVDVNVFDLDGYTALHWACFKRNILMVRLLLKVSDFTFHNHDRNDRRITPLGIAVDYQCFDLVKELLKCPKIDANIIDTKSRRYLYDLAAESNQYHICLEMEAAFKRNNISRYTSKRGFNRIFHNLHEFRVEAVIHHQIRSKWFKFHDDPRGAFQLLDDPTVKLPILPDLNNWKIISEDGSIDVKSGWKYSFTCTSNNETDQPILLNYSGSDVVSIEDHGSTWIIFQYMDNYRYRLLARITKNIKIN